MEPSRRQKFMMRPRSPRRRPRRWRSRSRSDWPGPTGCPTRRRRWTGHRADLGVLPAIRTNRRRQQQGDLGLLAADVTRRDGRGRHRPGDHRRGVDGRIRRAGLLRRHPDRVAGLVLVDTRSGADDDAALERRRSRRTGRRGDDRRRPACDRSADRRRAPATPVRDRWPAIAGGCPPPPSPGAAGDGGRPDSTELLAAVELSGAGGGRGEGRVTPPRRPGRWPRPRRRRNWSNCPGSPPPGALFTPAAPRDICCSRSLPCGSNRACSRAAYSGSRARRRARPSRSTPLRRTAHR